MEDFCDIPPRILVEIYQPMGELIVTVFSCQAEVCKPLTEHATAPPPHDTAVCIAFSVRSSHHVPNTHYNNQFTNSNYPIFLLRGTKICQERPPFVWYFIKASFIDTYLLT